MAAKKVLTRAESRAQTREEILEAAEKLFIANGYHGTSLATIAAETGRTIGAVYSNYESKEDLCVEVLKRRSSGELAALMSGLMASDEDIESRLAVLASWWARLTDDTALTILAAEYAISVFHSDQREALISATERIIESARVLLEDFLPIDTSLVNDLADDALNTLLATGIGLSALRVGGIIDLDRSVALLTGEARMWFQRLGDAVDELGKTG
ncbi:putative TetR family transcriptional regulator [Gordonia araii NBRC 100433]|uniref:Putative TetR family transcriptional regulator n=1 Tax=Gordonia araii NBRC 100433 TaxID=1073574 RepID=G7H254_9ACTN|nr:TetR/AcrR family transcriptional regulator [Gordonia araii]NNG97262.1 TetR/AcrR family transcriptional regulator [Gordonia araii NBRC 100433]GAB09929.1 putative TetR family transcriptional regulator [Gordonia araii NBRC 100433]